MNHPELTACAPAANVLPMQDTSKRERNAGRCLRAAAVVVMGGELALGGCVSVNAPDKPIVIELNINIKQEVIYRLAKDAEDTINKNSEIF